jgi:hypothetical protein
MVELIGGALKKEPEETVVEIDSKGEEAEKVVKKRRRRKKACDPHQNRACVDCKKRCARIHGRAASSCPSPSSSKARPIPAVPSFFKVMMGYFSEHMVWVFGNLVDLTACLHFFFPKESAFLLGNHCLPAACVEYARVLKDPPSIFF